MFDLTSLKNILDELVPPPLVDSEDRSSSEMAGELIEYYVLSDPLLFAEPTFHEKVKTEVFQEMQLQLTDVFNYDIDGEIENIIDEACRIFACIVPRRSYFDPIVIKPPNKERMQAKIDYLRSVPQPEQRTPE